MFRNLVVSLIGVSLSATMAFAQSQIGGATLNGTITDASGAVVAAAKVTTTQPATGLTRTTETSDAGLYSFPGLPVGLYDITVEKTGFGPAKYAEVPLKIGSVTTIDIKLSVGATAESVTVSAEAALVETTASQTSTTVDNRSVTELPIKGRNFLDFVSLTPGVTGDPTRSGDLSFGGQRGTANSVQIDGADSNNTFFGQALGRTGTGRNPYSFSQDSVQEFQVNANTFAAEIGRAGGGVVNVVTKSGTNQFHGTAFEFFRDKGLNANKWENNRNGSVKPNYHYHQYGATVGGPIKKDKAFFFFDYDGQRNSEGIAVILGAAAPSDADSQKGLATLRQYLTPYARALNNDVYLIKGDVNITDRQRLSVRFNSNRFTGKNYENSGITSALGHTGDAKVTTDNLAGNYTVTLTPNSLLESRFAYTRDNEPGEANSADPEVVVRQGGATVINIGRNNFSPRYTNAKTMQWVEGYSLVRGRHSYKMGADMIWQKIDNYFPGLFSGSYLFNSYAAFATGTPAQYQQAFAGSNTPGPLSQPNVNEYAFYAQDSWRVTNRLTLNYGVRYDLFQYAQGTVKNPDAGLAALNLDTSRINRDKNNFAPRIGFAYRLADKGSLTLRGGWGMFYGRTPSIMTGTSITQNGIQVQTYTLTSNLPTYPSILTAPPALSRTPDIYVFDPNYQQPLSYQWSLNLERQFARSYTVTLGYLGVKGTDLSRSRDINLQAAVPTAGTLADGTAVSFLRHPGRVNSNFGRITLFDSTADSIYHGVFFNASKRFADHFQFLMNYTFAKALDTRPDFTSVVVGTDDGKNVQDTLNPNLDRGRGNADIRQRFVLSGLWDINYAAKMRPALRYILSGYQLGIITQLQSGRPYNVVVGSGDPNNDGNTSSDRPFATGRNTFEGDEFMNVDLRFTKDLPIWKERVGLKLMFEAFNMTNRANFANYNTSQYSFNSTTRVFTPNTSNFKLPTSTGDQRILQLGARITF